MTSYEIQVIANAIILLGYAGVILFVLIKCVPLLIEITKFQKEHERSTLEWKEKQERKADKKRKRKERVMSILSRFRRKEEPMQEPAMYSMVELFKDIDILSFDEVAMNKEEYRLLFGVQLVYMGDKGVGYGTTQGKVIHVDERIGNGIYVALKNGKAVAMRCKE